MTLVLDSKSTNTPMLDAMIRVMENITREQQPFSMSDFFYEIPTQLPKSRHDCTTAACIIGYCVIDDDFFNTFLSAEKNYTDPVRELCRSTCSKLCDEIGNGLAESIYEGTAEDRSDGIFSLSSKYDVSDLIGHLHIDDDTDSQIHALNYMKAVRKNIERNGLPS